MFNQATLGVEALSADWDVRANAYAPFGSRSRQIDVLGGNPFADFAGGTIQIVTPGQYQHLERALTGVDGEIGWRAPVFDVEALTQVQLYGGGFYFDGGGITRDVAGPRGRIEFSIDDVANVSGARLTLGAEVQHDGVRCTQGFAIARLRVPLQATKAAPRLTAQERRMTERVVRDVDIVSNTGRGTQLKAEIREAAINTWNNQTVTDVAQVSVADTAALQTKLNALGAGSVIILNGAPTVLGSTVVNANQTLLGGGTALALRGTSTGTAVTFVAPGAAGNLTGAADTSIVRPGAGSVVGGLAVGNTSVNSFSRGIMVHSANDATIFGNTITTTGASGHGAEASFADNAMIFGNTVTTAGKAAVGIGGGNSSGVTVRGNTITTQGDDDSDGISFRGGGASDLTISGNTITTAGTNAHGIYYDGVGGTVSGNMFGDIGGNVIYATGSSSFMLGGGSAGNSVIGTTGPRCGGFASGGRVFFTDGINCY